MCLSIPKQVVAWEGEGDFAWVERNGQREFLNMMLLGPQPVGTWVLALPSEPGATPVRRRRTLLEAPAATVRR